MSEIGSMVNGGATQESDEYTKSILSAMHAGVMIIDAETHQILDINKAALNMIGFKKEDVLGKVCHSFVCPAQKGACPITDLHQTVDEAEKALLSSGQKIPIIKTVVPITLQGKKCLLETFVDITERKKAEETIKQSEEYSKSIFSAVQTGIMVVDAQTHEILDMNKAALDMVCKKKEEVVGKVCHSFVCPAQKGACPITDLHQTVDNSEKVVLACDSRKPIIKTVVPVTLHGKLCLLESFVDITERKKMEEALKTYSEKLEQMVTERTSALASERDTVKKLLDQKNQLINQLSHDLRTPLTPIVALLPIIESKMTDPKEKEMFKVVENNIEYMHKLLLDTLKIARLDSETIQINKKTTDMHSLAASVFSDNEQNIKTKGMKSVNAVAEGLMVYADELKLREVLENLVSNSIKYSQNRGDITISAERGENGVLISVRDEGIGIEELHLSNLFTEFYKVDESRHNLDSTGLGLAICRRIIEKHGGRIWAESSGLGKGMTVKFMLPEERKQ